MALLAVMDNSFVDVRIYASATSLSGLCSLCSLLLRKRVCICKLEKENLRYNNYRSMEVFGC